MYNTAEATAALNSPSTRASGQASHEHGPSKQSDEITTIPGSTTITPLSNFPENQLTIHTWEDPLLDALGHDPRSLYVERYWLPILGPSATLLLRRLAMALEETPDGFTLECADWALGLGIGMRGGKNGPFWRALDRCCRFGTTQRKGSQLLVRPKLSPLSMHQVMRLPDHLHASHHEWTMNQLKPISSRTSNAA